MDTPGHDPDPYSDCESDDDDLLALLNEVSRALDNPGPGHDAKRGFKFNSPPPTPVKHEKVAHVKEEFTTPSEKRALTTPLKTTRAKEEFTTPPGKDTLRSALGKSTTPLRPPNPRLETGYHPGWTLPKRGRSRSAVTMIHDATGQSYTVPRTKFNKAAAALDPARFGFLLIPQTGDCKCARVCTKIPLTANDVLKERVPIWTADENSSALFAKKLRSYNRQLVDSDGVIPDGCNLQYKFAGHRVCSAFWRTGMGASDHTTRKARQMAISGNFMVAHAGAGRCKVQVAAGDNEAHESLKCHTFWTHYFDTMCQRPNDDVRLFPTQEAFPHLYTETFLPYAKNLGWKNVPKLRCFEHVACKHPDFQDVKKRKKHTHLRCSECDDCKQDLARSLKNGVSLAAAKRRWEAHQTAIRRWREFENYYTQLAQSRPHEVNCFKLDDTESLGLPRFTNRSRKDVARKSTFDVIPCLVDDVSRRHKTYIYSVKGGSPLTHSVCMFFHQALLPTRLLSVSVVSRKVAIAGVRRCTR